MPARRFPPPWTVEDIGAAFVVTDGAPGNDFTIPPLATAESRRCLPAHSSSTARLLSPMPAASQYST
jgi:hypothetical protein